MGKSCAFEEKNHILYRFELKESVFRRYHGRLQAENVRSSPTPVFSEIVIWCARFRKASWLREQ